MIKRTKQRDLNEAKETKEQRRARIEANRQAREVPQQ
jgi:hypothetical protein